MRVSQTNSKSLFPPVIAREYGIWMTSSAALIICSLVLEIHQPALGFKFGNIAFFFACLMIVRAWLFRMREAVQPCVYDFFMFCYLAWAAYSISFSPVPNETAVQVVFAAAIWITVLCLKAEPLDQTLHILYGVGVFVAVASLAMFVWSPDLRCSLIHQRVSRSFAGFSNTSCGLACIWAFVQGCFSRPRSTVTSVL